MTILQVTNPVRVVTTQPAMSDLGPNATLEEELDSMVRLVRSVADETPDRMLAVCMGLMGRCTEIYLKLVRLDDNRKVKFIRTMQLQKVMDLIEFESRSASRLIEVRRQEIDLSK